MKVKRLLTVLAFVLSLCLLAGCGGSGQDNSADGGASEGTVDLASIETLGDAFALSGKDEYSEQRASTDDKYIYVFSVDGKAYRFTADLPTDIHDKIFELEFDDDYDKNEMALVADLPVVTAEDLTEQILSQEELDALVGKTGKELFDAGWRAGSFYNTETLEVWLEYGPYAYAMHFDGEVAPEEAENFDVEEGIADMKLIDAAFEGLGDATYID